MSERELITVEGANFHPEVAREADLDAHTSNLSNPHAVTAAQVGVSCCSYVAKTGAYTLTESDQTVDCTANTFTISLPSAVGIRAKIYNIKNTGTGVITVDGNGTETIDGELTQEVQQWDNISIQSTGSNWIIL